MHKAYYLSTPLGFEVGCAKAAHTMLCRNGTIISKERFVHIIRQRLDER